MLEPWASLNRSWKVALGEPVSKPKVDAVFPTSGPQWEEGWECLRQDMVYKLGQISASAWDHRMEKDGEAWMLDGLFWMEDGQCHLTGIKTAGWYYNFRHRAMGHLRVRFYLARILPPVEEEVKPTVILPIKPRRVVDDGQPF